MSGGGGEGTRADVGGGGPSSKFEFFQPNRDLESNWEVDLARKLEDYLLKICSGEVSVADDDAEGHFSVNFAEAALVIQGSVQVYSRKVEYLYSLVLHVLEFLLQKREENQEKGIKKHDIDDTNINADEEHELFVGLDDVEVEEGNCLDDDSQDYETSGHSSTLPANLLVLKGECLDDSGGDGELESYLLATCDLYEDFLLLDLSDAETVRNFLKRNNSSKQNAASRGSSARSKNHRSFMLSPSRRSTGTRKKSMDDKNNMDNAQQNSGLNADAEIYGNTTLVESPSSYLNFQDTNLHYEAEHDGDDFDGEDSSDEDDDDPWKPLNPHETGDIKGKPFKKGKSSRLVRTPSRQNSSLFELPVATFDSTICPEFADSLKSHLCSSKSSQETDSPPLYEKLRRTLVVEKLGSRDGLTGLKGGVDEDNISDNDLPNHDHDDLGLEDDFYMDKDAHLPHEKNNDNHVDVDSHETFGPQEPNTQESLEDLCRKHLDELLANITETEKQTELAARVMTWKQGIERAMEEQESHPPFDIHDSGEKILHRLSSEANEGSQMSFMDIVSDGPDYNVARTFSALLQLVNNRNVDLERGKFNGESICYTAENPFSVKLVNCKRRDLEIHSSRKKRKSSLKKYKGRNAAGGKLQHSDLPSLSPTTSPVKSMQTNGKFSIMLGKGTMIRCTPDGKRRRRSHLVKSVDL